MRKHEEALNSLFLLDITADVKTFDDNEKLLQNYIALQRQKDLVILDCIALLTQSGSNTKAIVAEKLRGLVE